MKTALCHDISLSDRPNLQNWAQRTEIDLVVVGPEVPLADGLADTFRQIDIPVFGPNSEGAQLEASKVFAKEFMQAAGVPTARFHLVRSVEETLEKAKDFKPPYVLKADGLAAGKGVTLSDSLEELELAAKDLFEKRTLGNAGDQALLEEFQEGWELSYFIMTNGEDFVGLPFAQDHKRLKDGDQGLNTGGMGAVAPVERPELKDEIDQKVVAPILREFKKRKKDGMVYRGLLYIGLMITPSGPSVIEFNVRFGDPEAQVILPLLEGDWGQAFHQIAIGNIPKLFWKPLYSSCVVLAAPGYPVKAAKGKLIVGDVFSESASSYFLHAGTALSESGAWSTNGGRVMNAIGLGSSLQEAVDNSYAQAGKVEWEGLQKRSDIGKKVL